MAVKACYSDCGCVTGSSASPMPLQAASDLCARPLAVAPDSPELQSVAQHLTAHSTGTSNRSCCPSPHVATGQAQCPGPWITVCLPAHPPSLLSSCVCCHRHLYYEGTNHLLIWLEDAVLNTVSLLKYHYTTEKNSLHFSLTN